MLPKSYLAFKWIVYTLATLFLCALQSFVFSHIRILTVTPFIYPILPAVTAMYEGPRRGAYFALSFGFLCDLLLPAPFTGFFVIVFPMIALLSASIAGNMLSPGFFCALLVSALGLLMTGGARVLLQLLSGGGDLTLRAWVALTEALLSLPALVVALPLFRTIHRRCASDY
ncbi:MAG: hypothetical protein K2P04_07035 [Oscillospiraceae bacterium]|nr:hypothetical protein [Oscillospiraceae bacterium]